MAAYTEVTNENVFQRLGSSIKNVLVGLILFAISFPLLWWNEGRSVETYKRLQEGAGAVVEVSADEIDSNREGGLVHISGMASTDAILEDPVFGISANAIRLSRDVEMYQWDEDRDTDTKTKVGGGKETVTTYTYDEVWADHSIDSSGFTDPAAPKNPGSMPYRSQDWSADKVQVGAFSLSDSLISEIGGTEPVAVTSNTIDSVASTVSKPVQLYGPGLYIGSAPGTPQIGDLKIWFSRTPPSDVSVVAKQQSELLTTYTTQHGNLQLLKMGIVSPEAMFAAAEQENGVITWVVRLLGFILMAVGIGTIFAPLAVMGDVIPFIGSMMRMGTGVVAGVLAFALSLGTIAVAWLAYRPVLGIALLAVALAAVVGVRHLAGGKEPLPPPPPPPPPPG